MTKRERLNKIAKEMEGTLIEKYGTSEGAMRAWDTRGRGRKAPEKKETQPSSSQDQVSGKLSITSKGPVHRAGARGPLMQDKTSVEINTTQKINSTLSKFEDITSRLSSKLHTHTSGSKEWQTAYDKLYDEAHAWWRETSRQLTDAISQANPKLDQAQVKDVIYWLLDSKRGSF